MSKETEKRLIRTLEFLKEPQGSTIPSIVRAMNGDQPQISLKKIVQTLRGCLESGILKVSDGRVKLKQLHLLSEAKPDGKDKGKDGLLDQCGRPKSACQKPNCPSNNQKPCPSATPKPKPKACKPKEGTVKGPPKAPPNAGQNVGGSNTGGKQSSHKSKSCVRPHPRSCRKRKRTCPKSHKSGSEQKSRLRRCRGKGRKMRKRSRRTRRGKRCPPKRKIQPYCKKKRMAMPYED